MWALVHWPPSPRETDYTEHLTSNKPNTELITKYCQNFCRSLCIQLYGAGVVIMTPVQPVLCGRSEELITILNTEEAACVRVIFKIMTATLST